MLVGPLSQVVEVVLTQMSAHTHVCDNYYKIKDGNDEPECEIVVTSVQRGEAEGKDQ